jgi:hypothetical protein
MHNIAAQYANNKEAAKLLPVPCSWEATLGSNNTAPSNAFGQDTKSGAKGGKKRHKRRP